MIGADGKHRRIPLDNSARSSQCVQFSTLDVDLYVGRLRAGKNLVKSDAVDHHATLADRGGFVSIAGERHRSGVGPHGRALQSDGFAFRTQGNVLFEPLEVSGIGLKTVDPLEGILSFTDEAPDAVAVVGTAIDEHLVIGKRAEFQRKIHCVLNGTVQTIEFTQQTPTQLREIFTSGGVVRPQMAGAAHFFRLLMHPVWQIDGVVRQEGLRTLPKKRRERNYVSAAQAGQLRFALCHPIGSFSSPDSDDKSCLIAVKSCRVFRRQYSHPFHRGVPEARIVIDKSDWFNVDLAQSGQSLTTNTSCAE